MLSGFRSRCTTPFSCAAARPRAIWMPYSTALRCGTGRTLHVLAQALPFEQFGDEIRRAVLSADVKDGQNVGVIERSDHSRFLFEAAQSVRVFCK